MSSLSMWSSSGEVYCFGVLATFVGVFGERVEHFAWL